MGKTARVEIANAIGSGIADVVVTAPVRAACNAASARAFHAMTIRPNGREMQVECACHEGIARAVARVETVEVLPLSAWYLDPVRPSAGGTEPRIARPPAAGDRPRRARSRCPGRCEVGSNAAKSGGEISSTSTLGTAARLASFPCYIDSLDETANEACQPSPRACD
ncbi:MAG TPA: hypothetical protein VF516_30205 [Kofleriaceae bacterium]